MAVEFETEIGYLLILNYVISKSISLTIKLVQQKTFGIINL